MADIPSYLQPNTPLNSTAPLQTTAAPAPNATTNASTPHVEMNDGVEAIENVYDVQNNTTLNIPHSEFEVAVRSGLYAPLNDKEYVVKDAQGQPHRVKGENLKTVFDEGSTYTTPEEAQSHLNQVKYGDQELVAGLEGFQRGFLPGVSDRLLTLDDNITQEDLAGRAEVNPISAGIGEAVGTFLSPGGKAAMAAGKMATKSLTKTAAKAGFSNKVAQAIVAKAIPAAAGSAVEGAYFGASHLLNEDALGNAQFNAENLLASVEQGALWGAAFGGGLSLAGSGVKSAAHSIAESKAGKYIADSSSKLVTRFGDETRAAKEFLGLTTKKADDLIKKDAAFMDDAMAWTKEVLKENPSATLDDVAAKATSDIDTLGAKIGSLHRQVDKSAVARGTDLVAKKAYIKNLIANEIDDVVLPQFKGVEGVESEFKVVKKMIDDIVESSRNVEGSYGAEDIHTMLRKVDNQIKFDKPISGTNIKQEMLRAQRNVLRRQLDSMVNLAEKDAPVELKGIFAELKATNRRFRTITSLEKSVQDRVRQVNNKSMVSLVDGQIATFGAVVDPVGAGALYLGKKFLDSDMLRKMQILGKIEKYQQKVSGAITSSLRSVATGVRSTEPLATQALVMSNLSTELVDGKKRKPQDEQQAYRNIAANAKFASENPEQFMQGVNKYSSHLYAVAPKTSGALDTAALNAMVYLNSKTPRSTKAKGFFDMHKKDKASGADLLKMQQRVDIITNPTKAIKLLGAGKLGATHVEALKAVYPAIYSDMQAKTMGFLASSKSVKLTYNQKLNMALLLDIQADESMNYQNVIALQSNFAAPEEASAQSASGQGIINPTQGGLAKVDKAERMDMNTTDEA